jgi:cobalt-zinc-cadmium efflux system membrane fusion protein
MNSNTLSRQALIGLMAFSLLAVHTGCQRPASAKAESSPLFQQDGHRVTVPEGSNLRARLSFEPVRQAEVRQARRFPGVIEADPARFARVFPPVPGRVAKWHVTPGEAVTNGQSLATLHSPDLMAAQGDFLKTRSAWFSARRHLERQQDLLAHKVASQREVDEAQSQADGAEADFNAARDRLVWMGIDPERDKLGEPLVLRAPQPGKVVELSAATGELHHDNNAPVATVADLSRVWLTVDVPETDVRFLRTGEEVEATLAAYPGDTFRGTVASVGDLVALDSRMVKARVELLNTDARLKPGMFASVSVFDLPRTQLTVPAAALVQVDNDTFVYEQTDAWVLEPRAVQVGETRDGRTVILSGLKGGAKVLARDGILFQ